MSIIKTEIQTEKSTGKKCTEPYHSVHSRVYYIELIHYQHLILNSIVIEYLASDQVRDKGFDPGIA